MDKERKSKLISWGIVLVIALSFFFLIFFLSKRYDLIGWINSLFAPGCFLLGVAALIFLAREGTFDAIGYALGNFFHFFSFGSQEMKYNDFGGYKDLKAEKRNANKAYYWPFLFIGGLLLVASIILFIVSKCN